jgi:WD40 repeat protein
MTVSLKHTFQSVKTDSLDVTLVQPSNWNQEHDLTLATNKLLGRATAGTGAAEEISLGTAVSISGGTLAVTNVPVANGGTGASTLTGYVKGSGTSAFTASATIPVGDLTGTLPVASGGTGAATLAANAVLVGNGTSAVASVAPGTLGNLLVSNGTSWTSAVVATGVSYPQNSQSANYTLVLSDAGKQIFHPASDTTTRTYTIPANASVAFPIGTVVLFTAENTARAVTVSITSDTLVFGSGTTGSVAVAPNNTLMAIKVTATKWMANYLYQTGNSNQIGQFIAVTSEAAPYLNVYPWSASGFGTKYANPTISPSTNTGGTDFNLLGNFLAMGYSVYPWSSAGFGAKYADPVTVAASPTGVKFSPAGDVIAISHLISPYISAYPWSGNGFGTKYSNPATLPTNFGNDVAFSPAGNAVAVASTDTPFILVYPWNVSTGFGTKYANPATLPPANGNGVAFNPAGDAIAVAHQLSPFIAAYPWNAGTGFGTKYANPATLPTQNGNKVAFSPAGNAIALAHNNSPYVTAYTWSGAGFGTKYADPAASPNSNAQSVAFTAAGDAIAVGTQFSPFVSAYPWSAGSGFGTKFTNPAVLPAGASSGVAFTTSA